MLKITRKRGPADKFRSYTILINNKEMGKIKVNQSLEFDLEEGIHTIRFTIDWCSSQELKFEISKEYETIIECWSNANVFNLLETLIDKDNHIYVKIKPNLQSENYNIPIFNENDNKKTFISDNQVAINTIFHNEYQEPSPTKIKRLTISILCGIVGSLLVFLLLFNIFYYPEDIIYIILGFVFWTIIYGYYVTVYSRGLLQIRHHDLRVYTLTNQNELYLIKVNHKKIVKELLIFAGVGAATSTVPGLRNNKAARGAVTAAVVAGVIVDETKRKTELHKWLSDPENIKKILNNEKLNKSIKVYRIDKTLSLLEEKKTYYKGKFLLRCLNDNTTKKRNLKIAKIYNNYNELIDLLKSKT